MGSARFILLLLISGMLTGCWHAPTEQEQMFSTYLQRLSHVLDVPQPPPSAVRSVSLPEKRRFLPGFPPVNMGLLESYQLRSCGLFQLISERNSILGKVQDQFHRFEYEIKLLHQIDFCLRDTSLPLKTRQKLLQIQQLKLNRLPGYWLSLLYASHAMRQQLSGSDWYQPDVPTSAIKPALNMLNRVHRYVDYHKNTGYTKTAQMKEKEHPGQMLLTRIQEPLEKQKILGHLLFTMDDATLRLNQITDFLTRHSNQIHCGKNRDNTKARYLKNVFHKFFIGEIQPYLASADAAYLSVQPLLGFLQPVVSGQQYIYPIEEIHQKFRDAILEHTRYWQSFSAQCHISLQPSSQN